MTLVSGEDGRLWLACQLEQVSYIIMHYCQGICVHVMFLLYNNSSLEMLFSFGGFLVSIGGGDQLVGAGSGRDSFHYRGHDQPYFSFVIVVCSSLVLLPILAILIFACLLSYLSLYLFISVDLVLLADPYLFPVCTHTWKLTVLESSQSTSDTGRME